MMKEKVIFRAGKNPYVSEQQYIAVFPDDPAGFGKVLSLPFYFSYDNLERGKVWFEPYTEVDVGYLHRETKIVHKSDARIPVLLRAVEEYVEGQFQVAEKIMR